MRKEQMNKKHPSVQKQPIDSSRIRCIPPEGFSWIDRRFVREGFIEALPPEAILLYFFLLAVGDAQGLSFYADPTISKILKLDPEEITQARARLLSAPLILYEYPVYQVLALPVKRETPKKGFSSIASSPKAQRGGDPVSLSEFLKFALKKAQDPQAEDSSKERL